MFRKHECPLHHARPVPGKLVPRAVERCHQQIARARALYQLQVLRDALQCRLPHTVVLYVQHCALRQCPRNLVHTLHADIRPRPERPHGQSVMKVQVPPVRLVDQQERFVRMADLRDRLQIRTHAVITRTHQEQRPAVGMLLKPSADGRRRDLSLYRPLADHLRQHIHRLRPGQDQSHERGLMRVSGYHDPLALKRRAEDHRLVSAGAAVDEEKAPIRAIERTEQPLCLTDRPHRTVQIIRERCLGHIVRKDPRSNPVRPARTDSLFQSVPGYSEIRRICFNQICYRLQQRCTALFHSVSFPNPC